MLFTYCTSKYKFYLSSQPAKSVSTMCCLALQLTGTKPYIMLRVTQCQLHDSHMIHTWHATHDKIIATTILADFIIILYRVGIILYQSRSVIADSSSTQAILH